jgi:hypothetical protein
VRLFIVEDLGKAGTKGEYVTVEDFTRRLSEDWSAPDARALDEALLATINIAHVGMVLPYRRGWVFLAEDASR